MRPVEQMRLWALGISVHNLERDECCPDFSCCSPELLAPEHERQAFVRLDDQKRHEMLMGFLSRMMANEFGERVHLAGQVDETPLT